MNRKEQERIRESLELQEIQEASRCVSSSLNNLVGRLANEWADWFQHRTEEVYTLAKVYA